MAERRPVITFVVPCYNSAAYVEQCLDSLLAHPDDTEVLIIDDGSTDDTAEIARSYEERYPGVVRLVQQPNGGHVIRCKDRCRPLLSAQKLGHGLAPTINAQVAADDGNFSRVHAETGKRLQKRIAPVFTCL